MKTMVLCVDRDDDFGVKAGLNSPFIGREENLNATLALGLRDAEDSDVNTLLAAISIYDEMIKKGMNVEVATICGDIDVGYESDLALATQLETVLEVVRPDRVVLVSDGAEDEYIYPMISSRVKVDSVRKVYVKQAPTVEGAYYVLLKMLQDDKMRKRIIVPIGLILFVFGIFGVGAKVFQFLMNPAELQPIFDLGLGMIAVVLGLYLLFYAYKVAERTKLWSIETRKAIRSGSQMIPFAVSSILLIVLGILYGSDAASKTTGAENDILLWSLLFIGGLLWMWAFAFFAYQTGKIVSHYLSEGKFYWSALVASVTIFAVAFIVQGAIDLAMTFLGYRPVDQLIIILEVASGFLLAVFGGLLNMSMRSVVEKNAAAVEGKDSTSDMVD